MPEAPIPVGAHEVSFLPDMGRLIDHVFADLDRTRGRAWVECYIFNPGKLGDALVDRLAAAAARGVDVRLLYDPLGSEKAPDEWFSAMRARGVDARPYRPATLPGFRGVPPRDHSRIVLVDDAGYTGGAAWGDQWLPRERGGEGWHDACCRVAGPLVDDFAALFELRWREAADPELPLGDYDTEGRHGALRLIGDSATVGRARVYDAHVEAFHRARRRIWIENSYFYPPGEMLEALAQAACRGVDVRLILPGKTDLPILKRAARADYGEWLAMGFGLWEYRDAVLHSKFAVVDHDWCSVGTFNANATSVGLAHELNLVARAPALVTRIARQFEEDLDHSEPVTLRQVVARPVWQRIVDSLARNVLQTTEAVLVPSEPEERDER